MKFIRFKKDDLVSYGIIKNQIVNRIDGDIFSDYEITKDLYNLSEIEILIPCLPSKIVCVGVNYKSHAIEMGHDLPEEPLIFLKPPTAVLAHEGEIIKPKMSKRVDYEAEVALIIGKKAFNIEPEEANNYIYGVTCFNDVTARDLQKKDGQWTRAKSFDTFAPFGPCITTDLDYDNLDIELILNGEIRQKSNTSDFIFNSSKIVSFISQVMTLQPGDVIATGTPSGIDSIESGDIIEVKVEGVGILRNTVRCADTN